MKRRKKEVRMKSFLYRARVLLSDGKIKESMDMVKRGLNYYSERIMQSISPYAVEDAGLLVISLRHIADEVERDNDGTKEFVEQFSKSLSFPETTQIARIKKPNAE